MSSYQARHGTEVVCANSWQPHHSGCHQPLLGMRKVRLGGRPGVSRGRACTRAQACRPRVYARASCSCLLGRMPLQLKTGTLIKCGRRRPDRGSKLTSKHFIKTNQLQHWGGSAVGRERS